MTLLPCPSDAELVRMADERAQRRGHAAPDVSTPERIREYVDAMPPEKLAKAHAAIMGNPRPRSARGVMNKTEQRVALFLDVEKAAGRVLEYYFDAISLRLADATHYRPDFVVMNALGGSIANGIRVVILEAKGHWEDDARVKIKVAAEQYPHFTFVAARRLKKGEVARTTLAGLAGFECELFRSRRIDATAASPILGGFVSPISEVRRS